MTKISLSPLRRRTEAAERTDTFLKVFVGFLLGLAVMAVFDSSSVSYSTDARNNLLASPPPDQRLSTRSLRQFKYENSYNYSAPDAGVVFDKAAPECGVGPDFDDFFQLGKAKRSRLNEDKIIYNLFFKDKGPKTTGTYVEMGAFDGTTESNSRFFDRCLGWKGLLIEGNPGNFVKAKQNRPRTHRMHFAPSCSAEYERVHKTITFYRAPALNSGLEDHAVTYKGKGRPKVEVPCGPLGPVLEDIFEDNQRTINFFSLDVEGAEPLVLKTIDFDKVMIEVLMIEVQNANCGKECESRDETRAIMKQAGYRKFSGVVKASDVFVHPSKIDLIQALEQR